jgi:hypothetical protein
MQICLALCLKNTEKILQVFFISLSFVWLKFISNLPTFGKRASGFWMLWQTGQGWQCLLKVGVFVPVFFLILEKTL